jgi:hypothetical protein
MQTPQTAPTINEYVNPIITYWDDDHKIIKKENRMVSCVSLIIIVILCALCAGVSYYIYLNYIKGAISNGSTDNTLIINSPDHAQITDYSTIQFSTNYPVRNLPTGVVAYQRPQIDLLDKIISLAQANKWSGNLTDNIGFTYLDFKSKFDAFYQEYQAYDKSRQLPNDMVNSLVGQGSDQIKGYIQQARQDFTTIITGLEINQAYIDEMNSYVLPENSDRVIYLSTSYDNSKYIGSSTDPFDGDYGRRTISIDPRDINYIYQDLSKTMLTQKLDKTALIRASTYAVVYHEMSNVLMQAYINLHVPNTARQNGDKNMWMSSDVDFLEPSKQYFWPWSFNKDISDARIAEGLMLKCISVKYSLSQDEINDLNAVVVKKDNINMNVINHIGNMLNVQYSSLLKANWSGLSDYLYNQITINGKYLSSSEDHTVLKDMFNVTNMLSRYIGQFSPAEEKDWVFFRTGLK